MPENQPPPSDEPPCIVNVLLNMALVVTLLALLIVKLPSLVPWVLA